MLLLVFFYSSLSCLTPSFKEIADQDIPWTIFVETALPDGWSPAGPTVTEASPTPPPSSQPTPHQNYPLPPFDKDCDVLLFFKYFEPVSRTLSYVTHLYCPISLRMRDLFPRLRQLAGLPPQTPILLYEEVKPTMVEAIEDVDAPLEKVSVQFFFCIDLFCNYLVSFISTSNVHEYVLSFRSWTNSWTVTSSFSSGTTNAHQVGRPSVREKVFIPWFS